MAISNELVDALKRCLKRQGLTYLALAGRLDVSEAAVKRMFSLRAMSLQRLEQICAVLDIGLAELSAEAGRTRPAMAQLSHDQEQALVDDPRLLLAMFLTLNRWREDDALAHFDFDRSQWTGLLARLDRLGIIELQPGNRARLLTARNFRWRSDGPMERYFRHRLLGDFFATPFDGDKDALLLLSGSLSVAGIHQLQSRLDELAREFDALLSRDATLPVSERFGVSLVLAQKPWLLELFEPYRRTRNE